MNGADRLANGTFKKGKKNGRKLGSKNRVPCQKTLNTLLDLITSDLVNEFPKLTTNQKIRILHSFARKYTDNDNVIELTDMKFKFDS